MKEERAIERGLQAVGPGSAHPAPFTAAVAGLGQISA